MTILEELAIDFEETMIRQLIVHTCKEEYGTIYLRDYDEKFAEYVYNLEELFCGSLFPYSECKIEIFADDKYCYIIDNDFLSLAKLPTEEQLQPFEDFVIYSWIEKYVYNDSDDEYFHRENMLEEFGLAQDSDYDKLRRRLFATGYDFRI